MPTTETKLEIFCRNMERMRSKPVVFCPEQIQSFESEYNKNRLPYKTEVTTMADIAEYYAVMDCNCGKWRARHLVRGFDEAEIVGNKISKNEDGRPINIIPATGLVDLPSLHITEPT